MKIKAVPIIFCISALTLSACGGSAGSTDKQTTPDEALAVATGIFIDSPVAGLGYKTPTRAGKTNSSGAFTYLPGEKIRFSVGDIILGEAKGTPSITPLTLVPEATRASHPKVTNIVRFLMTLDRNGDPADGITISADEAAILASGLSIDRQIQPQSA